MSVRLAVQIAAAALLAAALAAPNAMAQQDGRGWLGLGLQEQLECRSGPVPGPRPCERMFLVAQVVVDGPADRAGVEPGDTLVAVGGHAIASADGRAALAAIQPTRPVVLTLGRDGGRAELRVQPSPRPERVERVRGADGPLTAGRALPLRPQPAPHSEAREVVEVQTDGGQVVWIRRFPGPEGGAEAVRIEVPDPAALERQLRIARTGMEALERRLESDPELLRWVELELGPELRRLQDSVFHQARRQFESLREAHAREQAARGAAIAAREPAPSYPERIAWRSGAHERRLAGAEFEPLGPELAEFFQAERGLLVLRVLPGTPADRVGLRPGDVLFEAGGMEVQSLEELRRVLSERDGPHRLRWNRRGEPRTGTLPH